MISTDMSSHLKQTHTTQLPPKNPEHQPPPKHKNPKQWHNFPQASNFSWQLQAQMDYFKYHINLL